MIIERIIWDYSTLKESQLQLGLGYRVFAWVFSEGRKDFYGQRIEIVEYVEGSKLLDFFLGQATPSHQVLPFMWGVPRRFYFVKEGTQ